jgi:hypothetical protein
VRRWIGIKLTSPQDLALYSKCIDGLTNKTGAFVVSTKASPKSKVVAVEAGFYLADVGKEAREIEVITSSGRLTVASSAGLEQSTDKSSFKLKNVVGTR